jgi:hypothetical protein
MNMNTEEFARRSYERPQLLKRGELARVTGDVLLISVIGPPD